MIMKTKGGIYMPNKPGNAEIVKMILEGMADDAAEEEDLIHLLVEHKVSKNVQPRSRESLTLGERVADRVAKTAGSWAFIFSFCGLLAIWIVSNAILLTKPFDPYPFILLNLFLSCIAALQAPVIMMSQNRQEEKDRIRAENDYRVNLKSEIIIEDLHEKLDRLIANQEKIMASIQVGSEHDGGKG
jgi:uncharacterized membrane protein